MISLDSLVYELFVLIRLFTLFHYENGRGSRNSTVHYGDNGTGDNFVAKTPHGRLKGGFY